MYQEIFAEQCLKAYRENLKRQEEKRRELRGELLDELGVRDKSEALRILKLLSL